MMSRMWPDAGAVASRIRDFAEDAKTMNGAELKEKY